jgi:DNA-binding Lrp family transcriptional regulator
VRVAVGLGLHSQGVSVSVRDLEAEGVIQHLNPSKSVGMAEWSTATAMIDLQCRMKRLESDVARLNEVVAALMAKQVHAK